MSYEADRESRFARAEAALEEYFANNASGEALAIEQLLEQHADIAGELRELHEECMRLDEYRLASACVAPDGQPADRLSREFLEQLSHRPNRYGDYDLQGEIGRGGMGEVIAAFDRVLRRDLALKVVQTTSTSGHADPVDTRRLLRFMEEAQITGQLNHPGIIPVHEIGVDPGGRVYFTMKRVEGEDLGKILDRVRRGDPEWGQSRVLGVLLRVCETMAYAHDRGVIHRDLKPANVMVGRFGEVYVMDWGLARVINGVQEGAVTTERSTTRHELDGSSPATREGSVFGTPAYMPLEQAQGKIEQLGPRADVYSVGAMLYELVGGTAPYSANQKGLSPNGVIAAILAGPPPALDERSPRAPQELIAMIEKAMARELTARYSTMQALAEDLRAFLDGRVVSAFETGTWAETRKWVRRNRSLSAAMAVVLMISTLGSALLAIKNAALEKSRADVVVSSEKARRSERTERLARAAADQSALIARRNAEEARQRATETQEIADFQSSLLSGLSADEFGHSMILTIESAIRDGLEHRGLNDGEVEEEVSRFRQSVTPANATTAASRLLEAQILEPAIAAIDRKFQSQPVVTAALLASVGNAAKQLGVTELAQRALTRALDLRCEELGEENIETTRSMLALAEVLRTTGQIATAETFARQAVMNFRQLLGEDDPDTLDASRSLAIILKDLQRFEEAEQLYRELVPRSRAALGGNHAGTMAAVNSFSLLLRDRGRLRDAEDLAREALERRWTRFGARHRDTLNSMNNLAFILHDLGQFEEAESYFRECLGLRREIFGDEHVLTLQSMQNLALTLLAEEKLGEAELLTRNAFEGRKAALGQNHLETLSSQQSVGRMLQRQGRLDEAESCLTDVLERCRAVAGESMTTIMAMNNLAGLLQYRGRFDDAELLYRESLSARRSLFGDKHPDTLKAIGNLAGLLRERGRLADAEPLFLEAIKLKREVMGAGHVSTLESMSNFALLLQTARRFEEAEPLTREVVSGFQASLGDAHPNTLTALNNLGLLLTNQGKLGEAEVVLRGTLEKQRSAPGHSVVDVQMTALNLGGVLLSQGKSEEAESFIRPARLELATALGPTHPTSCQATARLGLLLLSSGRAVEAEAAYRDALAGMRVSLGERHEDTLSVMCLLAMVLQAQSKFAEAEPLYRESLDGFVAQFGEGHVAANSVRGRLRGLYKAWDAREPLAGYGRKAEELGVQSQR